MCPRPIGLDSHLRHAGAQRRQVGERRCRCPRTARASDAPMVAWTAASAMPTATAANPPGTPGSTTPSIMSRPLPGALSARVVVRRDILERHRCAGVAAHAKSFQAPDTSRRVVFAARGRACSRAAAASRRERRHDVAVGIPAAVTNDFCALRCTSAVAGDRAAHRAPRSGCAIRLAERERAEVLAGGGGAQRGSVFSGARG